MSKPRRWSDEWWITGDLDTVGREFGGLFSLCYPRASSFPYSQVPVISPCKDRSGHLTSPSL
jgi:hypothetical protein